MRLELLLSHVDSRVLLSHVDFSPLGSLLVKPPSVADSGKTAAQMRRVVIAAPLHEETSHVERHGSKKSKPSSARDRKEKERNGRSREQVAEGAKNTENGAGGSQGGNQHRRSRDNGESKRHKRRKHSRVQVHGQEVAGANIAA